MARSVRFLGLPVRYWSAAMLMMMLAVIGSASVSFAPRVVAQDPEAPANPPPAAAPVAPAAPGAPASAPKDEQSYLVWFYNALGLRYVIAFLGLSFSLVALVVMNILAIRRDAICPVGLVEGFEAHLNEKRYQEAYELAKNDESFLGQVLSAGLAKLQGGYDKATAAMQEVGDEENMKIEHRLSYIALIGTLAPMVGLLGTVDGMVASFTVIARSGTTPKASELAEGISMALVTTLVGLWLAIPAVALFNILKNRVVKMIFEASVISSGLMSRFEGQK